MKKNYFTRKPSKRSSIVARILYFFRFPYCASTDIGGETSYGYGELDECGFWKFQLYWKK